MITQVELKSGEECKVYWVKHDIGTQRPLELGRGIRLAECAPFWTINRIFVSLSDNAELPPKARIGTILELN